jgi:hypothetical protein
MAAATPPPRRAAPREELVVPPAVKAPSRAPAVGPTLVELAALVAKDLHAHGRWDDKPCRQQCLLEPGELLHLRSERIEEFALICIRGGDDLKTGGIAVAGAD